MLWRCITISLALICLLQFVMVAYHAPTTPAPTEPPWPHAFAATVDQQHQVLRRRHQHTLRHTAPPHELADAFELPAPVAFIDFDNPMNAETLVGRLLPPIMPQPALHRVFPATAERVKHHGRLPIHPPDATDGPAAIKRVGLPTVFGASLVSSVMSGLGGLPFFFISDISTWALGVCNASAAGLMLAAVISLLIEGFGYSATGTALGIASGMVFILISTNVLEKYESLRFGELKGLNARKVLLIMGVMTLHSLAEGVGMGMSFGGGEVLGLFINIAIAIHNIPEGLAIALVMVPRGVSPLHASLWGAFSSLPQPLMAIPAFLFVELFAPVLPWGLGFAAGAMMWMVFTELLPDAVNETKSRGTVAFTVLLALAGMCIFQFVLLENLLGEPVL